MRVAIRDCANEHSVELRTIEPDVQSQSSADAAVARIVVENSRLNVVMHSPGHMAFGPTEAFAPEQHAQIHDIDVLGTQRVNRAALPQLRQQGGGLVLWIGTGNHRR